MTLLQRTSQNWKIRLFLCLLFVGTGASLGQGFLYAPLGKTLAMKIAVAGMGLVVISFVWTGIAIRCPQCRLKLFVHAIRKEGFFRWFAWLLQVETCPGCGFGRVPRSSAARKQRRP